MTLTRRDLLIGGSSTLLLPPLTHADRSETGIPRLMQGPMIGAVDARSVRVWVRASQEVSLRLELSESLDFAQPAAVAIEQARAERDFTAVLSARGLKPDTRYFYRVLIDGAPDRYLRSLGAFQARTAPNPGAPAAFSIAFGSCARFALDAEQPIWRAVAAHRPDLFLWLGDNVYGDSLNVGALREEYRRQREVLGFQPLARSTPQLAIWDDHDYGLNNHDRTNPLRETAHRVFREYWANPAYGTETTPGVFFRQTYGAVDLFMLDGRYHRDPNDAKDGPNKTLLGAGQLEWLREELLRSRAHFKVLACGSGWTRAKGPGGDSWAAFLHERERLFEFIRSNDVRGVILISGDTHTGELNAVPWSNRGGYDFYDLVSSPLAQPCGDEWMHRSPELRIRQAYASSANFGLLRFEFRGEPTLEYNLFDTAARAVWSPLRLSADDLRNGQASWRRVIDSALVPTASHSAA